MLPSLSALSIEVTKRALEGSKEQQSVKKRRKSAAPQPARQLLPGQWMNKTRDLNNEKSTPDWRRVHPVDFVLENPADSYLWRLPSVRSLLAAGDDSTRRLLVKDVCTSYCKYGFTYRKNTRFYTTLTGVELEKECKVSPCGLSKGGKHEMVLQGVDRSVSNRIPDGLINKFVIQWANKHRARGVERYIFVDPFAGTGSVVDWVRKLNQDGIFNAALIVVDNRWKQTDGLLDLDMQQYTLWDLLLLGTAQAQGDSPFDLAKCAVLFWLSTECTTYSQNALWLHRAKKVDEERPALGNLITPTTKDAQEADDLNNRLVQQLQTLTLQPPTIDE